jgi:biopolymer transport protein ExbD
MPVHAPGPRLFSSIPFKVLGGKSTTTRKSVNAALNVTAMVDMMTMLVIFLLANFSATGELLLQQRGLQLPTALNEKDLEIAPIITITKESVSFKGDPVAQVPQLMTDESPEWKIIELYDRMQLEKYNFEKQTIPENKKQLLRGLVVLQADKATDAKVLNRVMKTAYAAEYTDVMFAVTKGKK